MILTTRLQIKALDAGADINRVWYSMSTEAILEHGNNLYYSSRGWPQSEIPCACLRTMDQKYGNGWWYSNVRNIEEQLRHLPASFFGHLGDQGLTSDRRGAQTKFWEIRHHDHWAPVHLAAYHGHTHVLEVLLARGADTQTKSGNLCKCAQLDGWASTPLHLAICGRRDNTLATVVLLLEAGAFSPSQSALDAKDDSLFQHLKFAASLGNLVLVETLIDRAREEDMLKDIEPSSWIHAYDRGHWEVLEYLIHTLMGPEGLRHLWEKHLASLFTSMLRNRDYKSCLRLAQLCGLPSGTDHLATLLCSSGELSLSNIGMKPEVLDVLDHVLRDCTAAELNERDEHGLTPLCHAINLQLSFAQQPNVGTRMVEKLIEKGASFYQPFACLAPGDRGSSHYTPLGTALSSLRATPNWRQKLSSVQKMLADQPAPDDPTAYISQHLHEMFDVDYRHRNSPSDGLAHRIPLVNVARLLILHGWDIEDRHTNTGNTVLMGLLQAIKEPRDSVGSFQGSDDHTFWEEDIILLLASLQHCGAQLDFQNQEGSTPLSEIRDFAEHAQSAPCAVADRPHFLRMFRLNKVIKVHSTTAYGRQMIKLHRPRMIPRDLPGDEGFIAELLNNDDMWLPCLCPAAETCIGEHCTIGTTPAAWSDHEEMWWHSRSGDITWYPRAWNDPVPPEFFKKPSQPPRMLGLEDVQLYGSLTGSPPSADEDQDFVARYCDYDDVRDPRPAMGEVSEFLGVDKSDDEDDLGEEDVLDLGGSNVSRALASPRYDMCTWDLDPEYESGEGLGEANLNYQSLEDGYGY